MKKIKVCLLALTIVVLVPVPTYAKTSTEIQKIEMEIAANRRKAEEARQQAEQTAAHIEELKNLQEGKKDNVDALNEQIRDTRTKIEKLDSDIAAANKELDVTSRELQDAINKIYNRDQLLRQRVALMYTDGQATYLDVLMQSTSFSDFLSRMDSLIEITSSDKRILEENKKDKEMVEKRKELVEAQLEEVEHMQEESESLKTALYMQKLDTTEEIAHIDDEVGELEDVTAEQEEALLELARKEVELQEKKRIAKKKTETVYYSGGKLGYPLPKTYRMSSSFGYRTDPVTGKRGAFHAGIDLAAPNGTSILAAEGGTVIVAGPNGGYGNCVIINHGKGLWTVYGHMRPGGIKVAVGQTVKRGAKIGEVGTTGKSTGYHLHFEVRLNEKAVSPLGYLK